MKKLVLILALVAVYGFAISNVSAKVITAEKSKITIISDVDDNSSDTLKKEDKKKDVKKAPVTSVKKAPAKGCCASAPAKTVGCTKSAQKSCAASKKACGTAKKAPAKKACCGTK